jgi:hypothetical protein
MKKFLQITLAVVVIGLALFIGIRYFFVFGEGVKAGELNYVVKKGFIFKTYEGKLIQNGLRSKAPNTVQSYEFVFSVSDEAVAQKLMLNSGRNVELHYKEYIGSVPWRGYSEFVVDSIVAITDAAK